MIAQRKQQTVTLQKDTENDAELIYCPIFKGTLTNASFRFDIKQNAIIEAFFCVHFDIDGTMKILAQESVLILDVSTPFVSTLQSPFCAAPGCVYATGP